MENPLKYFGELTDPRVERTREHLLEEILYIAIAAVLSGAESWNEIADYGAAKQEWFSSFLRLPGGIPSHDTFNRVFSALDPEELERCFLSWVRAIAQLSEGEVVSIDGKTLRGSRGAGNKAIVHMVSAWANQNNLVLAQRKVDDKSNEITAIPKLLAVLELQGCVVTIDALGCQTAIAGAIVARQADYLLAVKENQGGLLENVRDSFALLPSVSVSQELDAGHSRGSRRLLRGQSRRERPRNSEGRPGPGKRSGATPARRSAGLGLWGPQVGASTSGTRGAAALGPAPSNGRVEQRACAVIADLSLVDRAAEWTGLRSLVRVETERYTKATGKTERETRFYISTLAPEAARINRAVRQHWGIENSLHWVLDVAFHEDHSRKRAGHAAQNFSLLNRIALNLLKSDRRSKLGIHGKRLKAGWDNRYLAALLSP